MSGFPNDEDMRDLRHLWHALIAHRRRLKCDERFAGIHELSAVDTGIIDMVAENPEIIMREVGMELGLPKSTLTSIIDRLEDKGFLHRVISSRDRRSYGLALSDLGVRAYEAHTAFEVTAWEQVLATLSDDEEREGFLSTLRRIVKGLG